MSIVSARIKWLFPFVLSVLIASQSTAWALGQQCIGCQPPPAPAAVRNHVPASSLLYQAPEVIPQTVRVPRPVAQPVYRAPTKLPSIQTAPVAPAGSVEARVLAVWPGDRAWVIGTVSCESGWNPSEVGGGGNNYYGLFQFGPWARSVYGNPLNMSVEQQTLAAWRLLKAEGSTQWACSPFSYHP